MIHPTDWNDRIEKKMFKQEIFHALEMSHIVEN